MPVNDIREIKTDLRNGFKDKRGSMSPEMKIAMDAEIQSRFLTLRQYSACKTLFTYVSKDIEVDTYSLIEAAIANGKRVAVPRCITGTREMSFYYIKSVADLEPGAFGVMEPAEDRCTSVKDYSHGLCIVPGLSFDAEGYRLGYGKGYYDRFLSKFGGLTVGLCYSNCIKWKLPHGYYDRPVDLVVTDRYIRRTGKNNGNV